eukprot:5413311-Amphidinium_carterae.1
MVDCASSSVSPARVSAWASCWVEYFEGKSRVCSSESNAAVMSMNMIAVDCARERACCSALVRMICGDVVPAPAPIANCSGLQCVGMIAARGYKRDLP